MKELSFRILGIGPEKCARSVLSVCHGTQWTCLMEKLEALGALQGFNLCIRTIYAVIIENFTVNFIVESVQTTR